MPLYDYRCTECGREVEVMHGIYGSGEIFAAYLGYAVAFGLERTWIRKFSAVPATPIPTWYFPYYGGRYGG